MLERRAKKWNPVFRMTGATTEKSIASGDPALSPDAIDREEPVETRLGGSLAAVVEGWKRGASIFRVHDVAATRQALAVAAAIEAARTR